MEEKVYERQVAKQSLSSRVVDELQVHRHFSMSDLNELYTFTPPVAAGEGRPTPVLPKDRLMAELLTQYHDWIDKYHEHDSLLENVVEEELNEEERQLAWEDFENDKNRAVLPNTGAVNFPLPTTNQVELFRKSLKTKFPNASEPELNAMLKTLMLQLNYVNYKNAQQFTGRTQQQQPQPALPLAQQSTSKFQAGVSQTAQPTPTSSTNVTSAQQMFNFQRNHLYKKYNQEMPTESGKMMGNAQIKQNQRIGNAQTKVAAENYLQQMREQQQANLIRVQNQKRMQQSALQNQQSQFTQQPSRVNIPYQQTQNRQQQQVIQNNQQRSIQNRQLQPTQNRQQQQPIQNRLQQPIQNRQLQQPIQNRQQQQLIQNRQPIQNRQRQMINNRQATTNWKQTQQPTVTIPKPNLVQRSNTSIVPHNRPPFPIVRTSVKNPPQPVQKTEQQLKQEEMRRRISKLQQQKQISLQQKQQQRSQANAASTAFHKKKLDEMKNRYRASRNSLPTGPVSIVEIDDDPVRPSGSSP